MTVRTRHLVAGFAGLAVLGCSPSHGEAGQQEDGGREEATPAASVAEERYPPEFPAEPEEVTDPVEIATTVAAIDDHLEKFGLRVRSCDQVVRIQIGKDSLAYGRGLAAFGGFCELDNDEDVALCYEQAIGRFAIVSGSFVPERPWLADFTLQTCATLA